MKFAEYEIIRPVRAPELKPKEDKIWYKVFEVGDKITGYEYDKDVDGVNVVPLIIAQGRWRIPLRYVKKVKNIAGETAHAKVHEITGKSALADVARISRGSATGALLGMIGGFLISWYFGKSKFGGAFIGSVAGGLTGNLITKNVKYKK